MTEIRWSVAAAGDELWEGDILDVEVADEQVLLVHLYDGRIKAFQGLCPHQEILLADGKWDPDTNRLLCPGHNWEFDMTTGAGVNPAGCHLYEYPVEVDGDDIKVGVPQDGESHHLRFST
ncbi:MAG: Rieske 2Fe-2S domain-containing protein [Kineosporiaceae bacterium]|nr:Rieske 2Fe-2S domain-containing protein [Kineosporiaceae bacterium]